MKIERSRDLEILTPLLERLNIQVIKEMPIVGTNPATLSKYLGKLMDTTSVDKFEEYLQQTREGWESSIS